MSFFGLKKRPQPAPVRSIPPGMRLYAVGDVHGRFDLLLLLLEAIVNDSATAEKPKVCFLGDYVDRGPQSREVIEALVRFKEGRQIETFFLRGNHDETLLKFTEEASLGPTWCNFGGGETLESYGVSVPASRADTEAWEAARVKFCDNLGERHFQFFQSLELSAECGDYFFVHAGVRPGVPLDEQDPHDLLWIRDEFLRGSTPLEKTIVHGHTPEPEAFVSPRRIGVDTGAYASGVLTAIVLEGIERRLLQAKIVNGRSAIGEVTIAPSI